MADIASHKLRCIHTNTLTIDKMHIKTLVTRHCMHRSQNEVKQITLLLGRASVRAVVHVFVLVFAPVLVVAVIQTAEGQRDHLKQRQQQGVSKVLLMSFSC